jgi:hypothetical protein
MLSDDSLDDEVKQQIRSAEQVWGIRSPLYAAQQSYSYREKEFAEQCGLFRSYPDTGN